MSAFSIVIPSAGTPLQTPTDMSIPSPPDNTPADAVSPIIDDNNGAITSIISYHEQAAPAINLGVPPLGYIHNNMDSQFVYPIYIKNQLHISDRGDKYILTPFIKYTSDYTQVHGMQGTGREIRTLLVQIGCSVRYTNNMTSEMWGHLRRGSKQQFMVDEAMEQLGDPRDPRLRGEVNYYWGKANILETLNNLYCRTMSEANKLMREVLTVEGEVRSQHV